MLVSGAGPGPRKGTVTVRGDAASVGRAKARVEALLKIAAAAQDPSPLRRARETKPLAPRELLPHP